MDFSWLLALIFALTGSFVFLYEAITGHRASISGWAFVAGAFSAVLIASVPVAKARLLANATVPAEVAKAMSTIKASEASTDIQEIIEKLAKPEKG